MSPTFLSIFSISFYFHCPVVPLSPPPPFPLYVGKPVNVRSALWNYTLDARLLQQEEWVSAKKK